MSGFCDPSKLCQPPYLPQTCRLPSPRTHIIWEIGRPLRFGKTTGLAQLRLWETGMLSPPGVGHTQKSSKTTPIAPMAAFATRTFRCQMQVISVYLATLPRDHNHHYLRLTQHPLRPAPPTSCRYGLLRSPWNTNPVPYVLRSRYVFAKKDGGWILPSCVDFGKAFSKTSLGDYFNVSLKAQP